MSFKSGELYFMGEKDLKTGKDSPFVKIGLVRESESRDSHTYHYLAIKTKKLVIENQKLRLKKFNPAKQVHEWFVEAKLPPHN